MSLSVSKKASSLVVATSMAAVEALKDQVGLCRWDYALRSLYQRGRRAVPVSLSASSPSQAASSAGVAVARTARPRRSEEEKLRKAYHIVCWGPN
ncbi:uncharacterized protein [Lolium perenne]|uniref:uncharacterized protein n=1 Tax=Lolium perenne TaxID=4522 RepID=UPI0021EABC27|nr:uncharacterized protein LOC127316937 [Lolium perenne]